MVRTSQLVLRIVILLCVGVFVALPAAAQVQLSASLVPADPAAKEPSDSPDVKAKPQPGAGGERLFYTLPNYLTVDAARNARPLTTEKKFELVARNTFDPVEYPWYALQAGIRQAADRQPEYGQGAAGYGKRYALTFADSTVQSFVAGALLPSLLRQDPRYFRMGRGPSTRRRMGYAMSRIFVTRGDSGRRELNFSEIAGGLLAAGISNYGYHPESDHNLQNVFTGWGTQMAFHTFSMLMKEFWPDARMKMALKKKGKI